MSGAEAPRFDKHGRTLALNVGHWDDCGMDVNDDDWEQFRQIALAFARHVRDGEIVLEGRSAEEIRQDVAAYFERVANDGGEFGIRHDYEPTLASEASKHHEKGRYNPAIVLHATRVEHWLNHMVMWAVERRGFDEKYGKQVIREATLRAKTGWLWHLLFDEPMPADLVIRIHALAEQRNAFVHYKWQAVSLDDPVGPDHSQAELSASGPQLVEDLQALEDRLVFGGMRDSLAAALMSGPPLGREAEEPLT